MNFQSKYQILFVATITIVFQLYSTSLILNNYSDKNLWVNTNKHEQIIAPGAQFKQSGMTEVYVFPLEGSPKNIKDLKKQYAQLWHIDEKQVKERVKNYATAHNWLQVLGDDNWEMSFDDNYLYMGRQRASEPRSILMTSDLHVKSKSCDDKEIKNRDEWYKKQGVPTNIKAECTETTALRDRIIEQILDNKRISKVAAVIIPGDMSGGYGTADEKDAFEQLFFTPVSKALKQKGSNIWLGLGNHDCYWQTWQYELAKKLDPLHVAIKQWEREETEMMAFVRKQYGTDNKIYLKNIARKGLAYFYSFNLGPIHVICLGTHPSAPFPDNPEKIIQESKDQDMEKIFGCEYVHDLANSLQFLKNDLKNIDKDRPIIIFYHFPSTDAMGKWWRDSEKREFASIIKDYKNAIALLVGHAHGPAILKYGKDTSGIPDIKAPEIRAVQGFADISYDPTTKQTAISLFNAAGQKTHSVTR